MSTLDPQKTTTDAKTAQDVFALTGTTFAGTTQMTETGPSGDAPWVRVEDDPHAKLLVEAELRAEHQAQARATMLDLAKALDESNKARRDLGDKLRREYEASALLRTQRDRLQSELDAIELAEEKKKADALLEKALKTGNGLFFNMMLEKSRDAYDFSLFDPESAKKSDGTVKAPDQNSSIAQQGSPSQSGQSQQGSSSQPGEALDSTVEGQQPGAAQQQGASQQAGPQSGSTQQPQTFADQAKLSRSCTLGDVFQGAVGDRVTVKWVVKLWWQEVHKTKERLEAERIEAEKRRKEEEERRKIEEAKRAAMEKVAKMVEDLKQRLENSQKMIEENEKRMKEMAAELQAAYDKNAQDAADAKAREDALKAENARLQAEKENTEKALAEMQAQYDASQEALRQAAEDFAKERNALNGQLRNINSELQEAMVMAKHMREMCLKAKREAANSVSPQKFAELMAHLEEMKNNLSKLMKDYNAEKDNGAWLLRCLDKNKRQLELERQFLPLLRKVRGPVGPKAKGGQDEIVKKKDAAANSQAVPVAGMPPIPNASPKQMRSSQSLGALGAGGGPLAGGRQSAGFQDGLGFGGASATTLR